jgi:uncharacterized membrane protein YsdA (DUF1294 family)
MYTLFDLLLAGVAFALLGVCVGNYVGWHMCRAKTETDRFFERLSKEV